MANDPNKKQPDPNPQSDDKNEPQATPPNQPGSGQPQTPAVPPVTPQRAPEQR